MVHQHAREHRLGDRRRADAHAGVVASGGPYRRRLAFAVDRAARNADAGSGFERDADQDILPGRDAAERSARVIREKALRRQLVAVLRALLLNCCKTGADLDTFHGVDAHHRASDVRVEPAVDRLAPADRYRACHHVHACAAGIARRTQLVHERFELRHDRRIRREKGVLVHAVPRLERDLVRPELGEVAAHFDTVALAQPFLGDRAGSDADRGFTRRGPAPAAIIAQAVFLPVRVIGVAGPEGVGERAVILAALVLVPDEKADRGAGGPALENAGKNLDAVGLLALRHVARATRFPPVEFLLDVAFRELQTRRAAVDDAPVGGAVALAERGHAIEQTEGVAGHEFSRTKLSRSLA